MLFNLLSRKCIAHLADLFQTRARFNSIKDPPYTHTNVLIPLLRVILLYTTILQTFRVDYNIPRISI